MWFFIAILFIWLFALSVKFSDMSEKLDLLEKRENSDLKEISALSLELDELKKLKTDKIVLQPESQQEEYRESEEREYNNTGTEQYRNISQAISEPDNTPEFSIQEPLAHVNEQDSNEINDIMNELGIEIPDDNTNSNHSNKNIGQNEENSFDFESVFLKNIFPKIGALAFLIGIGIFIAKICSFIEFTPQLKITLSYIVGLLIFGFGFIQKEAKMQAYKEILLGLGVSITFITTYCACALFELFSPAVSLIVATVILFIVYVIADKQKTNSMITIALIGGYLNPLLITYNVNSEFLFGYYIVVNLLSCIYVFRNPEKSLINFINLFMTFMVLASFIAIKEEEVSIVYPLILWAIYLIYDIVRKNKKSLATDPINVLNWLNFAILTIFTIKTFFEEKEYIGCLLLSVGLVYLLLIYKNLIKPNDDDYKPYMYSTFVCVLLATFFMTDGVLRIALWSIESLFLSFIACKSRITSVANWSSVFLAASITNLFFIKGVVYTEDVANYLPVWNVRTLGFIFPIVSGVLSYTLFSGMKEAQFTIIAQRFRFIFWSLIYLCLTFEVNNSVVKFTNNAVNSSFISSMLISIIGFNYSMQFKRLYNIDKYEFFNLVSYVVYFFALLLLFFMGSTYKPLDSFLPIFNIRFVAFIFSIMSAVMFSKWTKLGLFKYFALGLGFLLITFETLDFVNLNNLSFWALTIIWLIYAISISCAGILKNSDICKNAGLALGIISFGKFMIFDLLAQQGFDLADSYTPIFNLRFLAFILSILLSCLYANITKNEAFKYFSIILGFLLVHCETSNYISTNSNFDCLLTVMWLLYAGIITLFGIFKNKKYLKNSGIWISIASIIRIFVFDLADTDMMYKLIAFITLGLILLIVSYFYNKRK